MLQLGSVRANKIRQKRRDAQRRRETAPPAVIKLRAIQFIKKVKMENQLAVHLYDELCEEGCDREELLQLWHKACRLAGLPKKIDRLRPAHAYRTLKQPQINNH